MVMSLLSQFTRCCCVMWKSWSHGDGHWAVSTMSLLHCIDRISFHCHKAQGLAKCLLAFCKLQAQMEEATHGHCSFPCISLLGWSNVDHSLCQCHHTPLHNLHTHNRDNVKFSEGMRSRPALQEIMSTKSQCN